MPPAIVSLVVGVGMGGGRSTGEAAAPEHAFVWGGGGV